MEIVVRYSLLINSNFYLFMVCYIYISVFNKKCHHDIWSLLGLSISIYLMFIIGFVSLCQLADLVYLEKERGPSRRHQSSNINIFV